ncbi:hypothetical protein BGX38DRAFT_1276763 [Terfezia claveryi]|nr:hypothetical protein BGX38DRAFT_1276763 [Terfezia claveryi]
MPASPSTSIDIEMSPSSSPASTVTVAFHTSCSTTSKPTSNERSEYFTPQNLNRMLGSNGVPNVGPPNQSHGSGFTTLQEQRLMPIQESIYSTSIFTCINEAHIHWGSERQPTISNNSKPSSQVVTTRHANIKEGCSLTQRRDFNILVEPEQTNNLLPMERFRLCHPRDSATPYDIIQSRSKSGDVAAILSEINALM